MKYLLLLLTLFSVHAEEGLSDPFWTQTSRDYYFGSRLSGVKLDFKIKDKIQSLEFAILPVKSDFGESSMLTEEEILVLYFNGSEKTFNLKQNEQVYFSGQQSFIVNTVPISGKKIQFNVCPVSHNGVVSDDNLWLSTNEYAFTGIGVGVHGQSEFRLTTGSGYSTNDLRDYVIFNTEKHDLSQDFSEGRYPVSSVRNSKVFQDYKVVSPFLNTVKYEILGESLSSIGIKNKFLISDEVQIMQVKNPEFTFNYNGNKYTFLESSCYNIVRDKKFSHFRSVIKDLKLPVTVAAHK